MTKRKHKPLTAQGIARMKPDPGARRFAALVPWISEAQVRAEAMAKASPATTMPVTVPPWLVTRNSWVSVISQASTTNIAAFARPASIRAQARPPSAVRQIAGAVHARGANLPEWHGVRLLSIFA
jgi:hypothetical protein